MADYVRKVNADGGGGGALTIDVGPARHVDDAGRQHVICKNHLDQLAALARARRQP